MSRPSPTPSRAPPRRWPGSARRSARRAAPRSRSSTCGWRFISTRISPAGSRRFRSATCSTRASRARRRSRLTSRSRRAGAVPRARRSCARRLRSTAWIAPRRPKTAFKEAIGANPDDVQSYISYGNMLRGRERFAEAAEIYSQAIEPHRRRRATADWSIFYYRGIAYERTKQWPKAEADFKKALELSPDQPLVLNYLGYSWVDMGDEPRRGDGDDPQGGRAPPERRLHRRQPRLGALPARRIRRGGDGAGARGRRCGPTIRSSTIISATPTGRPAASSRRSSSGATRAISAPRGRSWS